MADEGKSSSSSSSKSKSRRVGKYEIGQSLGEGTFGKVKQATNVKTGEVVAIKILDKEKIQKQNMGAQVKKEISIMKLVRHRTVVKLKEVLASKTKIFIVLELVTGGELFDKIVEAGKFEDDAARFYFQQLVVGTMFCHQNGVCHRDLKPENLLLDSNQNLKISDFGLSAMYEGGESGPDKVTLLHTTCGTPNYVAPEVLADRGYDGYMADTWSIGVILFVFLAGYLPFDEPTMSALFRKISKADFAYPDWFNDDVKDLLGKILIADPKKRITLQEVTEHPWFRAGGALATDEALAAELRGEAPSAAADEGKAGGRESKTAGAKESKAGGDEGKVASNNGPVASPSAQDLREAIQNNDDLEHNDDEEGGTDGGVFINSFDLINACGGAALNRMFLTPEEKRQGRENMFLSQLPLEDIKERVRAKFLSENEKTEVSESRYVVRAIVPSVPQVTVEAVIKTMSKKPSLYLIELKRARGDILQFMEICENMSNASEDGTKGLTQLLK